MNINLTTEEKINRIYSTEEFCSICGSKEICSSEYRPCQTTYIKNLIDFNKINQVHKELFGF